LPEIQTFSHIIITPSIVRHHLEVLLKPAVELHDNWEELLDVFPGIRREELASVVASSVRASVWVQIQIRDVPSDLDHMLSPW